MFMTTPSPVDGLEITGAKSNRVTHGLLGRSWRLSVVERGPLRLSLQLIPSPSVDHICKTTDTSILVQNEAQRKDLDAPLMIVDRKQQAEEASFSSTCYSHNAPTGVMAGSVLFVTCIFALMSPSAGRDSHYKIPFSTDTSMSPSLQVQARICITRFHSRLAPGCLQAQAWICITRFHSRLTL